MAMIETLEMAHLPDEGPGRDGGAQRQEAKLVEVGVSF